MFREKWKKEAKKIEEEELIESQWVSYVACARFHLLTDKTSIGLGVRQFLSQVENEKTFSFDPTMNKVMNDVVSRGYGLMKHIESYMWRNESSKKMFSDQMCSVRAAVMEGLDRTMGYTLSCPDCLVKNLGKSSSNSNLVSLNKNNAEFLQTSRSVESVSRIAGDEEPLMECSTWIALKPKGFRPHKISFKDRLCQNTPEIVLPKSIGLLKCALRAIRSNFGDIGRSSSCNGLSYTPVGVRSLSIFSMYSQFHSFIFVLQYTH